MTAFWWRTEGVVDASQRSIGYFKKTFFSRQTKKEIIPIKYTSEKIKRLYLPLHRIQVSDFN
jgi:hypothetical protein